MTENWVNLFSVIFIFGTNSISKKILFYGRRITTKTGSVESTPCGILNILKGLTISEAQEILVIVDEDIRANAIIGEASSINTCLLTAIREAFTKEDMVSFCERKIEEAKETSVFMENLYRKHSLHTDE